MERYRVRAYRLVNCRFVGLTRHDGFKVSESGIRWPRSLLLLHRLYLRADLHTWDALLGYRLWITSVVRQRSCCGSLALIVGHFIGICGIWSPKASELHCSWLPLELMPSCPVGLYDVLTLEMR